MEGSSIEALLVRGQDVSSNKGRLASARSKSRGKSRLRLTSLSQSMRRC